MALAHSPSVITDGLMVYLDAANTRSYPGTGNTWYDLRGNRNFTLQNNPPFFANSAGGSIGFTAANSHHATATSLSSMSTWTVEVWLYHTGVSTGTFPAIICEALGDGWRLPSKDELNILYKHKDKIGGFTNYTYWSNSERGSYNLQSSIQDFNNGDQYSLDKGHSIYVRAIRAF
jgi:hypothetical protein